MLARGLDRQRGRGGSDCPEIGMLAGYFERSLSAAEIEGIERHASDCGRCQSVLAAMAKNEEPRAGQAGAPVRSYWRQAGLAAALGGAALAALVLLARRPMETRMAAAPQAQRLTPETGQLKSETAPAKSSLNAPIMRRAEKAGARVSEESRRQERSAEASRLSETGVQGLSEEPRRVISPSAQEAPTQPRATPAAIVQMPVTAGGVIARQHAQIATGSAVGAPGQAIGGHVPAVSAPGAGTAIAPEQGGFGQSKPPSILVVSRDGSASWRLGAGGAIARLDQSKLWRPQSSGVYNDLLAGAAPSATVCWVVGRSGAILRTIDGEHWSKISSPTESDLTAVSADSVLSAIVIAADGRQFATSDGGSTWHPISR
jgi:hypothetical protein